jgi:hypothetical protein
MSRRERILLMAAALLILLPRASAFAEEKPAGKTITTTPWAIQIEPVSAQEGQLPPDFAMAIYEKVIQEIGKSKKFQQVFRSGDRRAADVANLLILKTTLERFQRGSETKRAVTTVGGATKVSVHTQLATRDSKVMVDKIAQGTVRLFGGNLNATQNLAKNIAEVISQSSF